MAKKVEHKAKKKAPVLKKKAAPKHVAKAAHAPVKKAAPKKAAAKPAAKATHAPVKKAAQKKIVIKKAAHAPAKKAAPAKAAAHKPAVPHKPAAGHGHTASGTHGHAHGSSGHASPGHAPTKSTPAKAPAAAKPAPTAKMTKAPPKATPPARKPKHEEEEDLAPELDPLNEVDADADITASEGAESEESAEEVVLTDAEGRRYCRVKDCDQLSSVDGYCRYHYLLYWKKIQVRKKILSEGKLERYIEELTSRYPDKFLDMLRKDLRSEKEFLAAIQELEIDESASDSEFEEETQTYIDEVRGIAEGGTQRDDEDF